MKKKFIIIELKKKRNKVLEKYLGIKTKIDSVPGREGQKRDVNGNCGVQKTGELSYL